MKRLFGTDGIRGVAGSFPLDPPTLSVLGGALVRLLQAASDTGRRGASRPRVLIGRDTRESGPWIQEALIEGIEQAGGVAEANGIVTTPGLAFLTGHDGFQAGIMISASHNPYADNGIKIFGPDQLKLSDETERLLEEEILSAVARAAPRSSVVSEASANRPGTSPSRQARASRPDPALAKRRIENYRRFLLESLPEGVTLSGLRIALDCANGAASGLAPGLFEAAGAHAETIHSNPDGRNINLGCGALFPESLSRTVRERGADLGFAFDGDADRCLAVDRTGRVLDGDYILYIEALRLHRRGSLSHDAVVATVMSNLWLERKLAEASIHLVRTPVGDKYVLERMLADGIVLGGEQSGHVIFLDRCRAGDGILTALRLAAAVAQDGLDLARLADGIERCPQVIVNVPVSSKPPLDSHPEIGPLIRRVESEFHGEGRVLVRYSGTERLARVMVEGTDSGRIQRAASEIAEALGRHLG